MSPSSRHRLLGVLLAFTVVVVGVDLSRPSLTDPVREGAAAAVGPVQRVLHPGHGAEVRDLRAQRDRLRDRLDAARADVQQARAESELLGSAPAVGRRLVTARVVGRAPVAAPQRSARITIDAGTRDGVSKDRTVICAQGLVGRVISAGPWTSDVLVLGGRDVTVGVRVGDRRVLGDLSSRPVQGLAARHGNQLTLTLVESGTTHAGDRVSTLGSVGQRPFVPGVAVGEVVSVDPDRGHLGRTAIVRPYAEASSLDVVGVVLTGARHTPRQEQRGRAR